jgi:uncharacterized protein (DUF433 family)
VTKWFTATLTSSGGTPVFVGTRVPVRSLFDYLEGGDTLDELLRQFLSVRREQAVAALDLARESLLAMRVLLDEQLPKDLSSELRGHTVETVMERGWAG